MKQREQTVPPQGRVCCHEAFKRLESHCEVTDTMDAAAELGKEPDTIRAGEEVAE